MGYTVPCVMPALTVSIPERKVCKLRQVSSCGICKEHRSVSEKLLPYLIN